MKKDALHTIETPERPRRGLSDQPLVSTGVSQPVGIDKRVTLPLGDEHRVDPALQPKEAARYLGIDAKTLANYRCGGKGPAFIKGPGTRGSVRYAMSELERWRRCRTRRSTSDPGPGGADA